MQRGVGPEGQPAGVAPLDLDEPIPMPTQRLDLAR